MFKKELVKNLKKYLVSSFTPDQFLFMLRELEKSFDKHKLGFERSKVDLNQAQLVDHAVDYFNEKNMLDELITQALKTKELYGKRVNHVGLNDLSKSMSEIGLMYNPVKNRLEKTDKTGKDFGLLFEGKRYHISLLSVDIVDSTKYVQTNDEKKMVKVLNGFKKFAKKKILKYGGRVWTWEGDGGTAAFLGSYDSCTICGFEMLFHLSLFNNIVSPIKENVEIRIAINSGNIIYKEEIIPANSDFIEYTEKIQKEYTDYNSLVITESTYLHLNGKLRDNFKKKLAGGYDLYELEREKLIISDDMV